MRTILRVGIIVGGVAFVTLYALQSALALAVLPGIILAGCFAGLGTAKWLDRAWFGRQFAAGLRSGIIAAGMAGASALLALLTQGPHTVDQLASQSHLLGSSGTAVIHQLGFLGWAGIDILFITLATLTGIVLAAIITQFGALSKNRHAVQVITQARMAAQASLRADPTWATPSGAGALSAISGTHTSGLLGQISLNPSSIPPTSGQHPIMQSGQNLQSLQSLQGMAAGFAMPDVPPIANTQTPRTGVQQMPQKPQMPAAPTPAPPVPVSQGKRRTLSQEELEQFRPTEPALPVVPPPAEQKPIIARTPSQVRAANSQLTEAMREALASWAAENTDADQNTSNEEPSTPQARTPASSTYLNSMPEKTPAKRSRKKQNTEWLC